MNKETIQGQKQYHWLVAGNVVIETDGNVQAIPQNGMIITDDMTVGVHQLGKAQQALQMTLFKKLGEPAHVVDVIITNLVCLGHMTTEEFNRQPEGIAVQERGQPSNVININEVLDRG